MEFPRLLHQTALFACPRERYQDVRRNINSLKLIELGFSFFGDNGRRRTWQINFRDFDVSSPSCAIGGLRGAAEEERRGFGQDGINPDVLSELMRVIDVKHLTRFCGGLHLGMARL
ncbi:unnamed protein product [Spirodela intermedia]|uniref:Uncharacterized protein n=1 Tax=Spirodela intermedia TaxID=51605 RepID=A0A7I8IL82_SPIIN|nr:unnamed protein product [Spirodela intermedia]CAA6658634.1 unnamed protein product [Spirodela intermedia]